MQVTDDTTIAGIMHADQADAATDDLAKRIAHFYSVVKASDMPDETAGSLTETFAAMAIGQHFGIDVAETFGVGPTYGTED